MKCMYTVWQDAEFGMGSSSLLCTVLSKTLHQGLPSSVQIRKIKAVGNRQVKFRTKSIKSIYCHVMYVSFF